MEQIIIDRFEGNEAVCETENKQMICISLKDIPRECREGAVLVKDEQGNWIENVDKTNERRAKIQEVLDELFE